MFLKSAFRSSPFPGLVRRAEVGFVGILTLESEPIKVEDGNDKDLEVLHVPTCVW